MMYLESILMIIGVINLCIFAGIGLTILYNEAYLLKFDIPIIRFLKKKITDKEIFFSKFLSSLGSIPAILMVTIAMVSICLTEQKPLYTNYILINNLLLAIGSNYFIKLLFKRKRPRGKKYVDATNTSFPSGHTMGTVICYSTVVSIIFLNSENFLVNSLFFVSFVVLILGVAFSRVFLGVHYPTDIIGGISLGISLFSFTSIIFLF